MPRTRKEQAAARRLARTEGSSKMREAMRTGDDRYLPARDQGPVRRFIRDYVDSRFWVLELMLPVMVVLLLFGYVGSTRWRRSPTPPCPPCSWSSWSTASGCG